MTEREQFEQAIAALQAQRETLGDAVVDAALAPMREKLAALEAQAATEQRKQVTILFADVSGFTAMCETMDTEDVADTMNALWERVDTAIVAQGGTIDKHIGDAVMALWGVDQAREDDPERAIRGALDMQVEVAAFREERDIQLTMRAGLNTGPALLGEVRPGEFTAMGDTVNLASRMEHAAPVGSILITHNTYCHVRGIFDVQPQPPLQVKGKIKPVQTYIVQRARPRPFRVTTRGIEGVETHMVGRDAELLTLQNTFFDMMEDAETCVVTIVGDAGVGKSRLLHEFDNWINSPLACGEEESILPAVEANRLTCLRSRTTPEMQTVPYSILRDMFASYFDIRESDSATVALEKFRARTANVLESDRSDLVGHWAGFDFSASPAVQNLLGNPSFGELATAYFVNYVRAISSEPTVILLDDIHWADDSSLDMVDRVVTAIPRARLLIVCLTRRRLFERRPNWGEGQDAFTQLDLEPLSKRESRTLVGEILQKLDQLPHELRNLIVDGAEGNPYYVEELVKMLIEDGVIVRGKDKWYTAPNRLDKIRVPPTLTGVIQTRLDALPREEKVLLQQASVVGRLFWDSAVAELADGEAEIAQVDDLLDAVRSRELIFQRERSTFAETDEYIFKHAILRDVTYETVLLKLRRVYHKQVAEWLENTAGERIGEHLDLIARHYELAGETIKTVDYMRRAGDESLQVSAYRDAVRAFEHALALLPAGSPDQAPLTIQVGYALMALSDYTKARELLEQGLALAQQHDDDASRAAALDHLGVIALFQGDFSEARERLEESLTLARQVDDQARTALVLHELGWVDMRQGAYAKARTRYDESLILYRALGDRRGLTRVLNGMGAVAQILAEYEEATTHFTESLALCREMGDRRGVAVRLTNLGELARLQGDYATAQHHSQQALEIFEELGAQQSLAVTLGNLGHVSVAMGDHVAAAPYYHKAIQIAMTVGAIPAALEALAGLVGVLAQSGQAERALELLGLVQHHPALDSEIRRIIEPILADLRAKLPQDVVDAALEQGKSLELEAVVAEIFKDTVA
ncbi:MAG: tetratricopeptide repeat protein [Chloroflexi bacterium]|nr:tetratricopeptide repeat protein [Chloroflexota bacterium]